jgi:hypothetical protein
VHFKLGTLLFRLTINDHSPRMGFLGIWVGSNIVKNIYGFMKFLSKVEQCGTFEGEGGGIQFGVGKVYVAPIVFF